MIYFLLALLGLVTGLLAGLFGISGGIIVIPFLSALLPYVGVAHSDIMHVAIGTSLASMCITSISSVRSHNKKGAVLWDLVGRLAIGTVIGSILGAYLARSLPSNFLTVIFALFEFSIGLWMFFQKHNEHHMESHKLGGKRASFIVGFGISSLSALLGVGGGLFMVPVLNYFHVPMRKAVGTSAATSFLISFMGTLTFITFSLFDGVEQIGDSIYLPAFLMVSLFSLVTTPLGTKLAHILPIKTLRRFFGLFLVAIGICLLYTRMC